MIYAGFFGSHKVDETSPVWSYWMDERCYRPARAARILRKYHQRVHNIIKLILKIPVQGKLLLSIKN